MIHPLVEHGGAGPILHWAPANGFPLNTYQPLLASLAERFRCVSVLPRALGPDPGPPPVSLDGWEVFADDIVAGLTERRFANVVAIGHSFGGVASLLAAVRHRSLFRALVLLDPTLFPPERMELIGSRKAEGWTHPYPLAARAEERKSDFRDRGEAFAAWRDKPLFADWSDEALWRYVDGALAPAAEGGYRLRWPSAWEAYYYRSFHADAWSDVRQIDPELPVLVVGGERSDTWLPAARAHFARLVPTAEMATVEEGGHLFPQAFPDRTRELLTTWLDRIVP